MGAKLVVTLTGGASAFDAAGDNITIAGATLTAAAVPGAFNTGSATNNILTGSDSDQVGTAFASLTLATWKTAIQTAGADATEAAGLVSVTYDGVSNKLTFQFDASVGSSTLVAADLDSADLTGGTTNPITASEAFTAFVAQADSADDYIYTSASDSTSALMDVITNFTIDSPTGGIDDRIDLTAFIGDGNGLEAGDVTINNTAAASLSALTTLANNANEDVYVGRTATNAYVFVDTDEDGDVDLVIELAGITDLSGFSTGENLGL